MIHKRVSYGTIANMIVKVAAMRNEKLPLTQVVKDISRQMDICLDPAMVKQHLGAYAVEEHVMKNDVMVVRDYVVVV
jgi:hypothetical protein